MADVPSKGNLNLFIENPDSFPPAGRTEFEDLCKRFGLNCKIWDRGPISPTVTPTIWLVKCLDFFIGKDEVQLRDKILRFRSIALDSIPADLRKRVSHSPGNTIVPLDVNSLGQHGCRPGQRISVFGATYVQVTQPKPPPDNDVSLLPFILHIDGVRYQREIRKP